MPWNETSKAVTKGEIFIIDNDASMRETFEADPCSLQLRRLE